MSRSIFSVILIFINTLVFANVVPRNVQSFIDHEIVPDIISSSPAELLSGHESAILYMNQITFPNGVEALAGNELTPSEVTGVPALLWSADPDRYYTLIFCDADAPSRTNPEARSFLHWLVVNIPGEDVSAGATLTNILNSHPEPETGLHRYIFLMYEQPDLIEFEEQTDDSFDRRVNFSPEDFSRKYSLGNPVAGNFYQTENLED